MSFLINTLISVFLLGGAAYAQEYPNKSTPIRLVVPFGAGSSTDLIARAYGRALSDSYGVNVIVENKTGASGIIGVQAARQAAPDGYTLLLANSSTQVLNEYLFKKLPYDPATDFVPVAGVARFSLVLNAGPSTSFADAASLLEEARSKPGEFRFGHASASTRLSAQMMEHYSGVKMLSVPYKTMAAATVALASGEIDLLMNDASTAIPFYKTGKARPLAVTRTTRMEVLPDVATLQEQGLKEYDFGGWFVMYFPAETPDSVVNTMGEMLKTAAKSSYVKEALELNAFETLDMTPAELEQLRQNESEKWAGLVDVLGIEAQ